MILSSREMRELESRAIAGGVSADSLMEEAGLGIAHAVRQFFPWPGMCLAVFGKGNNGGDALAAARHLSEAGWEVRLVPAFPEEEWGALVRKKYAELGRPACASPDIFETAPQAAQGRALIVLDGLLGTGSSGPLRGGIARLCASINALRARTSAHVFALDLPTGLDGDTGIAAEGCIQADATLTIGFAKRGLLAGSAANAAGRLAIIPLSGLRVDAATASEILATPATLAGLLPRRSFDSHKGDYGRVGIIAGSPGLLGAAVLCAAACVRAGAGLVTLYSLPAAAEKLSAMCPPEIMVQPISSWSDVLARRHDVWAIGPGLGRAQDSEVLHAIATVPRPMVVDADALNALATSLDALSSAPAERVLTPHPGEMERLCPGSTTRTRREQAVDFAARFPMASLLLKGARTVIAKAGEPTSYNTTGNPGMATGGMGDTLTGVLAALIAQHLRPYDAARIASWLCGRAAELAISHGGETEESLTPARLHDFLPKAFQALRTHSW